MPLPLPGTHSHLVRVVQEGAGSGFFLRAFPKLVVEHAVLLASILHLEDGVNAAILSLGDGLPSEGVTASCKHTRLHFVKLFPSNICFFRLHLLGTKLGWTGGFLQLGRTRRTEWTGLCAGTCCLRLAGTGLADRSAVGQRS